MAKKPAKASIEKKEFDLGAFKKSNGLNPTIKDKELTWIPLSDAFHEAVKIPGIARGYMTSFRGYSNTGKSTAMYEAVVGCQKIGDLAVIIETEGNWNWEHARNIGVKFNEVVDEETGEIIDYEGDFIFMSGDDLFEKYKFFNYSDGKTASKPLRGEPLIDDVAKFITEILDMQDAGNLPRNLCFLWDSVGSLNGFKMVSSNASNNMWNASSVETSFKAIINHRIPSSRREGKPYTNTFAVVQKVWYDSQNMVIKHKGGEAFFYGPRLIFHYGGVLSHSTEKLKATAGGQTYQFGISTKIRCEKNQVNGIEEHGKIASTPHGYWNPDKIEDYKKEHKDFILRHLNTTLDDFKIEQEEEKGRIEENEL
jgi:hypothetical protein